jgi:FKBP-type peptidyl-prolyl cis-trans isomerase (trigger factor)
MINTKVLKSVNNITELAVDTQGKRVIDRFDEVFKEIAKKAHIQGFRPGKAPEELIKKQYTKLAEEEVIKSLVPDIYDEVIKTEKIDAIEMPEISEVKLTQDSLSFKVKVEVKPKIELKKYKGLKVTLEKIEVSKDDIDKYIDSIKKQKKIEIEVDDKIARGMGYFSVDDLKSSIEKELYLQKEHSRFQAVRVQIVKQLKDGCNFDLPESLVNRRYEELLEGFRKELAEHYGFAKEEVNKKEAEVKDKLLNDAREEVWIFLVFEEIAKLEKMKTEHNFIQDVFDFLLQEASWEKK